MPTRIRRCVVDECWDIPYLKLLYFSTYSDASTLGDTFRIPFMSSDHIRLVIFDLFAERHGFFFADTPSRNCVTML